MNGINGNGVNKAIKAKVKFIGMSKGQFPDEVIVELDTSRGIVSAIFASSLIDDTDRTVVGVIIDEREDNLLVDLPTYTFTSGSKVWFHKNRVLPIRVWA